MNTSVLTDTQIREQATWLEIDRLALRHNLNQLIEHTLPGANLMAMVKANAYGHGLLPVVDCIRDQVSHFGVASIEEALSLRSREIDSPILLFGMPRGEVAETAIQHDISLAVSSLEQAREISESAERLNKPAAVHIKVDTGMGRLGISKRAAVQTIAEISKLPLLKLEGIFTHFPQGAEEGDPFTIDQIRTFFLIIDQLEELGIHFTYRHAANSIGIAHYKEAHLSLVRPGISLYGLYPHSSLKNRLDLKPVLSWRARLILIKKLAKGESAGYSRTFVAEQETNLGIIPVGYSHGYPFALSNKASVLWAGKEYPLVGRVSMDYISINLGTHTSAHAGDIVTLIGRDGNSEISCETLAEKAGTISYEIVTRLNPSISRITTQTVLR